MINERQGEILSLYRLPLCARLRMPRHAILGTLDRFENKELSVLELLDLASLEVSMLSVQSKQIEDEQVQKKKEGGLQYHFEFLVKTKCILLSQRDNQTMATLTARGTYYLNLWRKQIENEQAEALLVHKAIPPLPTNTRQKE